jgi:hypothetical protein
MLGNIYNRKSNLWLNSAHDNITLNATNKTKTFSYNYPDISARIYKINVNHTDFDENASIKFQVDGGNNSQVTLFKYNTVIELIDEDSEIVSSPTIGNLKYGQYNLLALVTNNRAVDSFTNETNFTLAIEVTEKPQVKYCNIHLTNIEINYIEEHDDGTTTDGSGFWFWHFYNDPLYNPTTTFEDNKYTSNYTYIIENQGITTEGSMIVQFNENLDRVLTFSAEFKLVQDDGNPLHNRTEEQKLSGHDIEIYPSNNKSFKVSGPLTCGKIDNITYSDKSNAFTDWKFTSIKGCITETKLWIDIITD